jgi:hypothetical protein
MYKYFIMESFYWTVLVVAIIALIGALTYVGVLMTYYTKKDTAYPPVASSCPDFWTVSASNPAKCNIPAGDAAGIKNIGSLYETTTSSEGKPVYTLKLSTANTHGLDATNKTIDFSAAEWGAGSGAVCKKHSWANQNGLVWDGVSNYNSC